MSIKVIQIRDKKIVAKINQSLNKVGKNKNTCQMSRKKYHYLTQQSLRNGSAKIAIKVFMESWIDCFHEGCIN